MGEVKEFKEVIEVKAKCFIAKYTTKKQLAITSNDRRGDHFYNFRT